MKNKGTVLIFSGCAGSGKGTVLAEVRKKCDRFRTAISLTTRKPRPGEQEGVHYYYTTKEDFRKRVAAGELAEYTEYCDNYYGTLNSELKRLADEGYIAVLEIETDGALQIMEKFPEHRSVFLAPPTYAELEQRLRNRGTETEEQITKRMAQAREEILLSRHYQHLVINYNGAAALSADTLIALCLEQPLPEKNSLCKDKDGFPQRFLANEAEEQ